MTRAHFANIRELKMLGCRIAYCLVASLGVAFAPALASSTDPASPSDEGVASAGEDEQASKDAETKAATPDPSDHLDSLAVAKEAAAAAREAAAAARSIAEAFARAMPHISPPTEDEKEAAEPQGESQWTNEVGIGLISVTGNAQAVTTRVSAISRGEWRDWAAEARASGAYGQARRDDAMIPIARNGDARIRGERLLAEKLSLYVLGGISADHLASVEYQIYGEPGVSVTWVELLQNERPRLRLRTDVGFRGAHESRFQYYPTRVDLDDRNLFALRVGAELRYVLAEGTIFTQQIEVLPDVIVFEDVRVQSTSSLAVQVVRGLAVQVAFKVRHVGLPAEGRRPTDTELSAGMTVSF